MVNLRFFTYLILFLSLALESNAQLENGSIAPNFTITDLNGETHNLYDILDSDRAVVIDFFATWCTPCWVVHSSKALANTYDNYGVNGTNELTVFGIESDVATTEDDILGTGDRTIGNWTEGNDYPFADDFQIARNFNSPGYPSIFIIRPNKRLYFASDIYSVENTSSAADSLTYSTAVRGADDGRLINATLNPVNTVCSNTSIDPTVDIVNFGDSILRNAEVLLYQNDVLVEIKSWTGSLHTFQKSRISFNPLILTETSILKYEIRNPNNNEELETGDNFVYETYTINKLKDIHLDITTDFWPEDLSWTITNKEDGSIFFDSEVEVDLECDANFSRTFTPPTGCYDIVFRDAVSDGLINGPVNPATHSCQTEHPDTAYGAILLSNEMGDTLFDNNNFGFAASVTLSVDRSTSTSNLAESNAFELFPNPSTSFIELFLTETIKDPAEIIVFDINGHPLFSKSILGNHSTSISMQLEFLSSGMYFIKVRSRDTWYSKKFIKL